MRTAFLIFFSAGLAAHAAVVLDRVAVVVGKRAVKTSDIERDLRSTEFLNRQPLDLSPAARRKAADRLVEQELIRQEIQSGGYAQPTEQDANAFLNQLRRDRFQNSDTQLRTALNRYGLSEVQLREYLLWQLTVLRFIDQRFRPGVLITDEDVRAYAEEHKLGAQTPQRDDKIRETLTGERINQSFGEWLDQVKRRTRIVYRDEVFSKE